MVQVANGNREGKHFCLTFPVSLYVSQELSDSILDLFTFVCLFILTTLNPDLSLSFTVSKNVSDLSPINSRLKSRVCVADLPTTQTSCLLNSHKDVRPFDI